MPPKSKSALTDAEIAPLVELFKSIGLNDAKAADSAKSPKISEPLKSLIEQNQLSVKPLEEKQAGLVVSFATLAGKLESDEERSYVVARIRDGSLKSVDQITGKPSINRVRYRAEILPSAAITYLNSHPLPVDDKEFDQECGVGT